MNRYLKALKEIRAMATRGVPNCINLDGIDRIIKSNGVDLNEPAPTPVAVTLS